MRLVTFVAADGMAKAGALVDADRKIVDLAKAHRAAREVDSPHLTSVLSIIEGGAPGTDAAVEAIAGATAEAIVDRQSVRLRAPIHPPPQMRDCMLFEKHTRQCNETYRVLEERRAAKEGRSPRRNENAETVMRMVLTQPLYYKANRFAVNGPYDDVIWPSYSKRLDFELEFGVYISKPAKDVSVENARDYIFGYTIFNDVSARDAQGIEMQGMLGPAKGKDFDTANPMGPCLVTADELPDPYGLTMIARVNGEEWGRGNSGEMTWKFEDAIAFISRSETLHPGEFLGSGTVGNGCGLEQMRYLNPGDVVELEVEGIGVIRNRMVQPGT